MHNYLIGCSIDYIFPLKPVSGGLSYSTSVWSESAVKFPLTRESQTFASWCWSFLLCYEIHAFHIPPCKIVMKYNNAFHFILVTVCLEPSLKDYQQSWNDISLLLFPLSSSSYHHQSHYLIYLFWFLLTVLIPLNAFVLWRCLPPQSSRLIRFFFYQSLLLFLSLPFLCNFSFDSL